MKSGRKPKNRAPLIMFDGDFYVAPPVSIGVGGLYIEYSKKINKNPGDRNRADRNMATTNRRK